MQPIRAPSPAERCEEIPELARTLYADACQRHALRSVSISAAALHALSLGTAEWPGNVRQLAHVYNLIKAFGIAR